MKMRSLLFVLFFMVCVSNSFSAGYPEDPVVAPEIDDEEITGTIEAINQDISVILVKIYADEEMADYQEINFYVLREAIIKQDGKPITLKDLFSGEKITLRYRVADDGRKEVKHIWVTEKEPEQTPIPLIKNE
jgi:hypothetical protein